MVEEMEESLSNNEELKIEFNRDQFRQYAKEQMKAIKESRGN